MKHILIFILLVLICGCEKDDRLYYIRDADNNSYYTYKFTRVNNGIKFYDEKWKDTIELHGSFYIRIPKKYIRVNKVKNINHNDYSK